MNKDTVKHTIKIYNDILQHFIHHLNEGKNIDPTDIKQSKIILDEIYNLSKLKGGNININSNFKQAQNNAFKYLGPSAILYRSEKKYKKYKIYNPFDDEWIHFGDIRYPDFTYYKNRRDLYLTRSSKIKGDWINNPYSPNNLSRHILWD